jgi:hypothetical protein
MMCCMATSSAFAQDAPQLRDNRITVNAGATWLGGYDVGSSTAQLRGNGTGAAPASFTLFTADSHFSEAVAPEIRIGLSVTPRLTFEGGASLSHPRIGIRITGDPETGAQDLTGEELQQYVFDGGVTWQLPISLGRRLAPYVTGGAGYLRQLHEDRTFAETGRVYYAGGGARYWLRGGDATSWPAGLRGEFRMNVRDRGIDFEDKRRSYPTFSIFLFVGI